MTDLPCADKARFATQKQAEAAKINAKRSYASVGLTTYKCQHCGLYHIASTRNDD